MKREFIKIQQGTEVSQQVGTDLLEQQETLFDLWSQVRNGTLSRCEFHLAVETIGIVRLNLNNSHEQKRNNY